MLDSVAIRTQQLAFRNLQPDPLPAFIRNFANGEVLL